MSTATPLPLSSARIPKQAIDDDPGKQLELSVLQYELGECKYEFKMLPFTTTILNLLHAEAEKKDKIRHFRMYRPGSDGSSADMLSIDLKIQPLGHTITFRPEWRSLSKTVFTQYDPFEPWYTCHSNVWLDDFKRFYRCPMRCEFLIKQHAFFSCAKICRRFTFLSRLAQRQTRDAEQEAKERNIRQHSMHHRDPSDHVEFTD